MVKRIYNILNINNICSGWKSNSNPPIPAMPAIQTTGSTFQINNAKLYVPVVILYINDNIKFLENIRQGFQRTTSWNK